MVYWTIMRRTQKIFSIAFVLLLFISSSQVHAMTQSELTTRLNALARQYPRVMFRAEVGALEESNVLYNRNATQPSHPASNMKLFVTATALEVLSEDFVIETSVYSKTKPVSGVVDGDLILYGRGDPTLLDTDIADLVAQLKQRRITRITGNIVGDESYLRGPRIPPGRDAGDLQAYYGAEVSALSVYENIIGIGLRPGRTVGSKAIVSTIVPRTNAVTIINNAVTGSTKSKPTFLIKRDTNTNIFRITGTIPLNTKDQIYFLSISDPARYSATLFYEKLIAEGIQVDGTIKTTNDPKFSEQVRLLAEVSSKPLSEIIKETNKRSVNLFAELILRILGKKAEQRLTGTQTLTHDALGINTVREYLESVGIDSTSVRIVDGSGLGSGAQATPQTSLALLRAVQKTDYKNSFLDSLAIAGVDGTLSNRLKQQSTRTLLRAKTGTLDTASTLVGTIPTPSGKTIGFALYTTYPRGTSGQAMIDRASTLIAQFAQTN